MAKTIIGRNLPLYKGEYSTATVYDRFDVVLYDGSSYVSKLPNNQNKPVSDTTYWQLLAQRGEFTEQQLEDFKAEVVAESKEEMDDYTDDKKDELNTYTNTKETELNAYATVLKNTFDTNASTKTSDFNDNATAKTTAFNTNASSKTDAFDSNASTKTTAFNDNATSKTTAFNTNATNKTTDFNDNATAKTTAFDTNATNKTNVFDNNASDKTDDFNDNATAKTTAFDENAEAKTEEFDEHTAEIQADIEELQEEVLELSENMPWTTTEQATEIQVTDAAKYSKNKLELFGNTEQDNTKMTYKCDGTETGDYYLTYNSIDYYFTMPTIVDGDILVFNTTDLKLYLEDTEITTESTGTGTNLTFISSPNPDYPQDIHVVTGENSIGVQGKNLFDKDNYNIKSLNASANPGATSQYSIASNQKHIYIPCKPSTDYVIIKDVSQIAVLGVYSSNNIPAVGEEYLSLYFSSVSGGKVHVKTGPTARYLDIRINTDAISQSTIQNIVNTLFVAEGTDVNMSYTPYHHADYPINLGNIELCKIGDYQDYLYKENGNWYKYKVINNIILDGHREYTKSSTYSTENYPVFFLRTGIQNFNSHCNIYCNKLIEGDYQILVDKECIKRATQFHTRILADRLNGDTIDDYKSWLTSNNLIVYYGLATPTITQITDETLISQLDAIYEHLKLIKGTNNITVTAEDLAPNMQLSYMQDLPTRLNNLASRIELLEE